MLFQYRKSKISGLELKLFQLNWTQNSVINSEQGSYFIPKTATNAPEHSNAQYKCSVDHGIREAKSFQRTLGEFH